MEHTGNIHHPNASPMWCNANVMASSMSDPQYDGGNFWFWYPRRNYMVWFDTPVTTEELSGSNVCYRLQGNVWFCPYVPEEDLPMEPVPLPIMGSNIKPSMTLTSVKMENHPEHIAVMFGQVLSNLK